MKVVAPYERRKVHPHRGVQDAKRSVRARTEGGSTTRKKTGTSTLRGPRRKGRRTGQRIGGADDDQLAYDEKFHTVCKELKIAHELTPAKVLQLHGSAER